MERIWDELAKDNQLCGVKKGKGMRERRQYSDIHASMFSFLLFRFLGYIRRREMRSKHTPRIFLHFHLVSLRGLRWAAFCVIF